MNHRTDIAAEIGREHLQDRVIERAILRLLRSRDMRPGDSINIILAQYEIERKGINRNEFSAGVVELLNRGLLNLQGNVFYLTHAGFDALEQYAGAGHA